MSTYMRCNRDAIRIVIRFDTIKIMGMVCFKKTFHSECSDCGKRFITTENLLDTIKAKCEMMEMVLEKQIVKLHIE